MQAYYLSADAVYHKSKWCHTPPQHRWCAHLPFIGLQPVGS